MKKLLTALLFALPLSSYAQPSSQVAWTPELLKQLQNASPEQGKTLSQTCQGCHGETGISSVPNTPILAGQLRTYLYKQIMDYAQGNRSHPLMNAIASQVSADQAGHIAAWFATQAPSASSTKGQADLSMAQKLVVDGDSQRAIAPCEVCHGSEGEGAKIAVPVLAGQQADYIRANLTAFRTGERHNDIYSPMRHIAATLTDEEIKQLGAYYQSMSRD